MEISNFDKTIRDCIQSINAGTTANPIYCGWALAMRTRENVVFNHVKGAYPALIQWIEDKEVDLDNGDIEKTVDFYMVNPKDVKTDTLSVRALHDLLSDLVYKFQQALSEYYLCEFVGDRQRLIEQIASVNEAGILFTLKIQVERPC